jgi:hypothetical protein
MVASFQTDGGTFRWVLAQPNAVDVFHISDHRTDG